jgi:hypothetical protein
MLAQFAQEAEKAKVEVLVVGYEIDLHLNNFDNFTGELRKAVDEMEKTARQYYSGLITYCPWNDPWEYSDINWEPMDLVFTQLYKSDCTRELTDEEYLDAIHRWKSKAPGKPLAISEFGSFTMSEAPAIGPCIDLPKEQNVTYNPQVQADFIERQLRVLFNADVYGIFLHCWDEGLAAGIGYDPSEVGYGIWDWRSQEPKPSFWTVYKYYREG